MNDRGLEYVMQGPAPPFFQQENLQILDWSPRLILRLLNKTRFEPLPELSISIEKIVKKNWYWPDALGSQPESRA